MARNEPCDTLADSAASILAMDYNEFKTFEPRNAAEACAVALTKRSLRGDVAAFRVLFEVSSNAKDEVSSYFDGITKKLLEM